MLLLFLIYITRISTLRAVCRKRNNWLEIHKILWHKCVYICKILFPWAQEESSSRRQWVCWCCRMHCSTEIPSLNRLAGTLGNRAATEHQFGPAHPPRMVCELFKTFKPFFPLIPGPLTVVLKSQSVWWGHTDTGCNAAVLSQCANHVVKGSSSSRGRAACPCSLQSSQASTGLNSRLLQESTSFLSQSGSSLIWVLFYI